MRGNQTEGRPAISWSATIIKGNPFNFDEPGRYRNTFGTANSTISGA